ncbi:glycosyltransferase family 2 protein [Sulfurospirillum barnesii]|uniref:Glycosyl transferase n=1 Tax=Sulfurospirillum barnesii (strain ATCC 700032 / DSM 10660 / SES-3) TaxID=760154 RepID=I3XYW6_SULBS|nr:glycosyltransferase family 2 protein [Sulfurospirillum barnesii]AFL69140.1 glycosyl transferase [Sulfurospirillum barnesii SES-3]
MGEDKPFFSVVIPLYNKQNHVKETIETVLAQTFQDFEIVVVNDGSKDDSAKMVEAMRDERIRLINQENAGVSVARNNGIKEAKAEYIAFLDADDLWLPEFLQTIYELRQNFPDAGLYATAYKKRKANGEESGIDIQGLPSKDYIGLIPNYFESIVKGSNLVWTSATCIPKKVFVENNIWFPEDEKYGEDQYVWARVALEKRIVYNTKECAIYLSETENNTAFITDRLEMPLPTKINLMNYKNLAHNEDIKKWLSLYIDKHLLNKVIKNKKNKNGKNILKILCTNKFTFINHLKIIFILLIPNILFDYFIQKKNKSKKVKQFFKAILFFKVIE